MVVVRLWYIEARNACICIQARIRCYLQRKKYKRYRSAIVVLQAVSRMMKQRTKSLQFIKQKREEARIRAEEERKRKLEEEERRKKEEELRKKKRT